MKTISYKTAIIIWTILFIISLSSQLIQCTRSSGQGPKTAAKKEDAITDNANKMLEEGKQTFRYETFGDEVYWTDALHLDKAIAGERNGGIGPGLSPKAALAAGLKVDMDAIPADVAAAIKAGKVNLDDPAVTLTLLRLNALVGIKGTFDTKKNLVSIVLAVPPVIQQLMMHFYQASAIDLMDGQTGI
jgi:hypothetical protein